MKISTEREKINTILTRAVSDVIVKEDLENKLKSGKKLRVKLGIDPTSPDIHLGHTVSLIKLRQFQDIGHQAVLIIGDFTAMIGDPAGRTETRKPLTPSEIKKNLTNYIAQIGKIIDIKKTEIRHNGEWFGKMKAGDFYQLTTRVTVGQLLKREDFQKRIQNNQDITANEMMYPLFQGYDSVSVKADVELGGEDQKVNLLMGRRIQRAYGMPEQNILTTWLIEGADGARKMSKSLDNYIGISEKPEVIFGKLMSIPDALIVKYLWALTNVADSEIERVSSGLRTQKTNPRDAKARLAFEIVKMYYGEKKAEEAESEFERVFKKRELPKNIQEFDIALKKQNIVELLTMLHFTPSKSESVRLILGGAVKVNNIKINSPETKIDVRPGMIIQVGKKRFAKIKS